MRLLLSLLILTLTATSTSAISSLRQRSSRWNSNSYSNSFARSSAGGECCDFFTDCYLNDRCSSTCCWIFESSLGMLEEQSVKDGKHAIQQKQREDGDDDDSGENYDVAALQTSSHAKSSKGKHTMTHKQREDGDDGDSGENYDMAAIEKSSTHGQTRWYGTSFGAWLSNLLRQNNFNGIKPQRLNMSGGTCCDMYEWCQFGSQCDGTCCWAYENGLGLVETQADSKQQIKAKNLLQAAQKAQAHHEMKMSSKAQHKIKSHKQRIHTSQ